MLFNHAFQPCFSTMLFNHGLQPRTSTTILKHGLQPRHSNMTLNHDTQQRYSTMLLIHFNIFFSQEGDESLSGLSSDEAYRRLCSVVRHELMVFNQANNERWWRDFVKMLQTSSVCINWISLTLVLFQVLLVVFGYLFQDGRYNIVYLDLLYFVISYGGNSQPVTYTFSHIPGELCQSWRY
jgi:hypothetical protein